MVQTVWFRASVALAACLVSAPAAAEDAPAYVPPAGWNATVWMAPQSSDGFNDNVNLLRGPAGDSSWPNYVNLNRTQLLDGFTKAFDTDADEKCGPALAHRFAYTSTQAGRSLAIVQLLRVVDNVQYVVTYRRLAAHAADPAAIASLRTICDSKA